MELLTDSVKYAENSNNFMEEEDSDSDEVSDSEEEPEEDIDSEEDEDGMYLHYIPAVLTQSHYMIYTLLTILNRNPVYLSLANIFGIYKVILHVCSFQ